ncbi:hypothetical protein PG993_001619 [Apiospora rasikravindrae]|uniref:Hydantoinase n=1 Tax=Apiospora rasikravindrae TaxID=990691 RepID=A0ABR1UCG9_9PEZI
MTTTENLRIGVDVGGTNTDGVILDPTRASGPDKGILAFHKAPTTTNPGRGIAHALAALFERAQPPVHPEQVASVTIGTTHFVNAVVERDPARLSKVAVLRLCGPFAKHATPCIDWPADMRDLVLGYHARLQGGLEVDGHLIADIDPAEIRAHCAVVREKGIRSVVVVGIFSPIDTVERQEERAAEIVQAEIPGCDVVLSKQVANLGFIERENAAILNASILSFARRTIRSFQEPARALGLKCPVFITQNDGTILSGEMASKLPIRTFSSGPTNSMRGAAFLVQGELSENIMVVDIGGTTTDVGMLLSNGFPRQQAAYSDLAGVRMNFSCPDIKSIGLGGGSIVRHKKKNMTVGPDSVGYKLTEEALVFGGKTLTATDCTAVADPSLELGQRGLAEGVVAETEISQFKAIVTHKLEKIIDTMKTSPDDLPVLLVGGGAIIAPDQLKGASRVMKPRYAEVANAVGAAVARVSAVVDTVKSTESKTTKQLLDEICSDAIERTVEAGALRSTVKVVEKESFPLQVRTMKPQNPFRRLEANRKKYVEHKTRFIVRAAGDCDFARADLDNMQAVEEQISEMDNSMDEYEKSTKPTSGRTAEKKEVDISTYRPHVRSRIWYVSETDVEWIATGCYILGTGGGGSPYAPMVRLRQMVRDGAVVRVVNPEDLPDNAQVGCGGGAGSPTVGIEKLEGDAMLQAQEALYKACPDQRATHMISVEIGGGNGLQSMILGASGPGGMDLPAVDGDWMGRALPTKWQTTPVVFNERSPIWSPIAVTDGNGNTIVMPEAKSDLHVERIIRAALSQMGSAIAMADPPVTGAECRRWAVEHTISQSWRIGRAVAKARAMSRVDNVAETILEECGGPGAGQVLFKGKIVGVERTLRMGHVYGECIIEGADVAEEAEGAGAAPSTKGFQFEGLIKIPFKNENIAAIRFTRSKAGGETADVEGEVLGVAPDLITVIDAQNGEAIGTPEYRYGLLVIVLGITASEKWTTERGIEIGGPKGFGMDHLTYKPLGKFVKPKSVIDEFDLQE